MTPSEEFEIVGASIIRGLQSTRAIVSNMITNDEHNTEMLVTLREDLNELIEDFKKSFRIESVQ